MLPILSYKVFASTEDFESWQKEGEYKIYQFTPIPLNVDVDVDKSDPNKALAGITFSLFVVYSL